MSTTTSATYFAAALAVMFLLVAGPASAAVFTVTLTNDSTIETHYRPIESADDESKVKMITENGNWISLPKDLVKSITSDFEVKGYGTVLNSGTIVLGWSPNNAPTGAEGGELDSTERMLNYFQQRDANNVAPAPYSVQQFVEPNSQGGIPISFGGRTTPPIGSSGGQPVVAPQ
ncbi:MAG: YgdI/YgdR family lipoprotein [Acidobacteriota bacterium]|nr:YgdI/YgdR family lipoprotein [Acidobacteriota bacterium]